MTTYTRESLKKLNEDYKLEIYNKQIEDIVNKISDRVIYSAKFKEKKEVIITVQIIEGIPQPIFIAEKWYDLPPRINFKQLTAIIEQLKAIFLDSNIYFAELNIGKRIIEGAIHVNWE
jgi:hypothetical protein